jgi:hypothetical protein
VVVSGEINQRACLLEADEKLSIRKQLGVN